MLRLPPSRMASCNMVQNSGSCMRNWPCDQCQRLFASMVIGRSKHRDTSQDSTSSDVLYSAKLAEENQRIKAARASGRTVSDKDKPPAGDVSEDDEGSIVSELTKSNNNCGACRTRESETWWKAPKGLVTNVLCDNCGISWRKYADLNIRPMREDAVTKSKLAEKREGTPLAQTVAKRPRVGISLFALPLPPPDCSFRRPYRRPHRRHLLCLRYDAQPVTKTDLLARSFAVVNANFACTQVRSLSERESERSRICVGAYGATVDPSSSESWTCELCLNEKNLEASLVRSETHVACHSF